MNETMMMIMIIKNKNEHNQFFSSIVNKHKNKIIIIDTFSSCYFVDDIFLNDPINDQ